MTPRDNTTYSILATNAGGAATGPAVPQITVDVSSIIYEFIPNAKKASWYYNDGKRAESIDFGGSDTDKRGSASLMDNVRLCDDSIVQEVLWTHPSWIYDGWIMGEYDLKDYVVQEDDHIYGKVALKKGASWGDVIFELILVPELENATVISETHAACSDGIKTFDIYLNRYAGKKVDIALATLADGDADQDWALWLDLKLIRG